MSPEPQLYFLEIVREEIELLDPCDGFVHVGLCYGSHNRSQKSHGRMVPVAHLHRGDLFVMRLAEYTADTA